MQQVPERATNIDMKTMSAGKSLKTFSCVEVKDKTAIGENTVILSKSFGGSI